MRSCEISMSMKISLQSAGLKIHLFTYYTYIFVHWKHHSIRSTKTSVVFYMLYISNICIYILRATCIIYNIKV